MSGIWQRTKSAKQTKRENYRVNKTTKILLTISLASFLASLTGVLWGFFLPVGAIIFGLFMIFNMLGKETVLFDEEQRVRVSLAEKYTPSPARSQWTPREAAFATRPTR
jgi:hypothetical protein